MKKSLFRLASVALIGSLLGRALRYSFNIVIARGLGADALGVFAFGLVIMKGASVVSRLGLDTTVQKFVPEYLNEDNDRRVSGVVVFSLALSFLLGIGVSAVIYYIIVSFNSVDGFSSGLILLTGVPLFSSMMVAIAATRGFEETKYGVYIRDIVQSGSGILFLAIGSLYLTSTEATLFGYVLSIGLGLGIGLVFLQRLGGFRSRPRFQIKKLLSFSIPVLVVAVSQYIVSWTDVVMLSALTTPTEVGWYQAAYQSSVLITVVLAAVNSIFPPVASRMRAQNKDERLGDLYASTSKWVSLISLLGLVFISAYGETIMSVFDIAAEEAVSALVILGVGQAITVATGPAGFLLTMSGKERVESGNTVFISVVNIILNYFLIIEFGIVGAAAATSISFVILNVTRVVELKVILDYSPYRRTHLSHLPPLVVASSSIISLRYLLGGGIPSMLLVGTIGVSAFAVSVWIIGLNTEDEDLIRSLR
jgi:O-antigen/teichoic acid export membrane protein